MSLALAENPQVAQALGVGSGGGSPNQIISPNGSTVVTCSNGTLQSYGLTTRLETSPTPNSAYVDIREMSADNMYVSLNSEGSTNVAHVKVGGTSTNDGLYVGTTQLLYNGTVVGGIPPVLAGVESLQGLVGALTFSSSDDSININAEGTIIDLTSNGGGGSGVASLSDGSTALTGAITLIGEGCSITATNDPSPAMTISVIPVDAVNTLNGTSGTVALVSADGSVTITPNVDTGEVDLSVVGGGAGVSGITVGVDATVTGAVTLVAGSNINLDIDVDTDTITINASVPAPVEGVTSIQVDSEGAVSGTVNIITGLGVSAVTDVGANTITLSSDPYVGSCWLTAPQDFTSGTANVGYAIFDTQDPFNDNTVVSYDLATGFFTVLRAGVYQLNWICSVSNASAVWPTLSSAEGFISIALDPSTVRSTSSTIFVPYPSGATSAGFRINTTVVVSLNVNATFRFGLQWQTAPTGTWGFFERSNTNGLGACASWSYIKALEV